MTEDEAFLALPEAAAYTAISMRTLRRRIANGQLHAVRSGRLIRVRQSDLDLMFAAVPRDEVAE